MSRVIYGIEKGLKIWGENSDTVHVSILFGSAAPGGDTGDQDGAGLGSLYMRTNGSVYKKTGTANTTADWLTLGDVTIDQLRWRNERVVAATNDTITAGTLDVTTLTDNESGLDGDDFVVGDYILGDANGVPALFRVTVHTSPTDITVAAASQAIVSGDTFIVQNYLPDPGATQEAQAIIHIPVAGSPVVKISDVNWNLADGITLNGYVESQGPTLGTDTLQVAIQKNGGDVSDLVTLSGVARGAVNLGTFTGITIADSRTIKQALQDLETASEEIDQNADDLITLSGVAENATTLGTFTGITIPDSQTIKAALQALETASEEIDANADDLITLSGVAENVTTLGTFTGTTIPDSQNVKQALQSLETAVEARAQITGVTTITTLDSVLVDNIKAVKWFVHVFEEATPANMKAIEVFAVHNGTAAADATTSDNNNSAILKLGSNFNLTTTVDVSGTGGSQVMRLRITSTSAGVTATSRRVDVK